MEEGSVSTFKKVRREGGSTVLTVGKLVPSYWRLVSIKELSRPDRKTIVLEVKRVA